MNSFAINTLYGHQTNLEPLNIPKKETHILVPTDYLYFYLSNEEAINLLIGK